MELGNTRTALVLAPGPKIPLANNDYYFALDEVYDESHACVNKFEAKKCPCASSERHRFR